VTRILHRQIGHSYPAAASAHGVTIRDTAGKEYIDASSGAAVSCLGHSHPDVLAAMREQLDRLAYAHTSFFTSQVAEELADELIAHAPQGIGHVFYVSGGSEAVEAALKLARQYFVERGGSHSGDTSSHDARAIMALRSARLRSEAGNGSASNSVRC
jgi:adenosylmethionine-8-amino-7-oxononanoate aminotransferase